jgi:hypothetical protein
MCICNSTILRVNLFSTSYGYFLYLTDILTLKHFRNSRSYFRLLEAFFYCLDPTSFFRYCLHVISLSVGIHIHKFFPNHFHICVYLSLYLCIFIFMSVYMYLHMCVYLSSYLCIFIFMSVYIYLHICLYLIGLFRREYFHARASNNKLT